VFKKIRDEHNLKPEEIERINTKYKVFNNVIARLWEKRMNWEEFEPKDGVNAFVSPSFNMACMAYNLTPGPLWHSREVLTDPKIIEFTKKVSIDLTGDPVEMETYKRERGKYRKAPLIVEVWAQGQKFTGGAEFSKGESWHPDYKLTRDELISKFEGNVRQVLDERKIHQLVELVEHLEEVDDITQVTTLLSASSI
jgi:2-methylcitrate dehydratase PrpD